MQDSQVEPQELDALKRRVSRLSHAQKLKLAERLQLVHSNTADKLVAYITTKNQHAIADTVIGQFVKEQLPTHFAPQKIMQVKSLPRTSAGKLQRNKLDQVDWQVLEKPILEETEFTNEDDIFDIFGASDYAAPSTEIEETLANIWSEVLGVEDISIHDEFLEVGGDSLLSIRILARINKAGLSIRTEDFFQFPTIAGQAKAIERSGEHVYEQGSTKGKFPLLPIQKWLFERVEIDCHHWNQSVLLEVDSKLRFESLQRAWQMILMHHDALRIAILPSNELSNANKLLQQEYRSLTPVLPLEKVVLPTDELSANMALIESHCQDLNASMSLNEGQLAKLVFFETPDGLVNYAVIVIHHAIVDAESWRIILEDLEVCLQGFEQNKTPVLPKKTTSYKHWVEKLVEYAQSAALQEEIPYWLQQKSDTTIPLDMHADKNSQQLGDINIQATSTTLSAKVDLENAASVLNDAGKQLGVEVKDILIAAIVESVSWWSGNQEVLLDIEGHGREELFDNIDTSRTVGWFTSVYPVLFRVNNANSLESIIPDVASSLAQVPNKGIGHGVLREFRRDANLHEHSYSQVCFNYLGNMDANVAAVKDEYTINSVQHNIGKPRSDSGKRAFLIEINARIQEGILVFDFSYSQALHNEDTISRLGQHMNKVLCEVLAPYLDTAGALANNEEQDQLFELSDLDMDEIDAISKVLKDN